MFKESRFNLTVPVLLLLIITVITGCNKEEEEETNPTPPAVTTRSATTVGQNWATMRGSVKAYGISTTVTFEYDTTTSFEHSIAGNPQTVESDSYVEIKADINGLETDRTYYYRIIAENQAGETVGSDTSFTTLNISDSLIAFNPQISYGSLEDIDGNIYKTIEIGTQTWMAENLRTLKLNDGTAIPFVEDADEWGELETPAYCRYVTDTSTYGSLYNWYTVSTEKLCPEGWSVPTDEDWIILTDQLGGDTYAGNLLKESGSRHWAFTNSNITNDSGYTALPGGYRNLYGTYGNLSISAYFWSATEGDVSNTAYYRSMYYGYSNVDRAESHFRTGFSVRCIKNTVPGK